MFWYETCDDGNLIDLDGCSSDKCQIEFGFYCNNFPNNLITPNPSVCYSTCGDGLRATNEGCDDKNLLANDGCSPTCIIEPNGHCDNQAPNNCDICGNLIRKLPE